MGLLNKIFNRASDAPSTQYRDSDSAPEQGSKNAPRRELVHVVLRDTMRQHGVPTDWIDCAILSVVNANEMTGMHVHLIMRNGHERLLGYIPAFQSSFMMAITKFDPRVADWLLSLSWQFENMGNVRWEPMPDARAWTGTAVTSGSAAVAAGGAPGMDSEMEEDLKALFAIRDAAMIDGDKPPHGHADFQPTQPGL